MSTTVDSRVVEMRFDNKQFESNVSTTMSTLDKLKAKLGLGGASKGLEDVGKAAKNVDMSGLSNGVETVQAKFSALQVIGVTALSNITNSVVNAGKQLLSSLTIQPIKEGFSEYEMTLNAIQTTMAATSMSAEDVQKELKKLDEYADKTVYSTADMLNNLPKFTNAGVHLEDATQAMIGIANATALAGGDAGKASIAFYNLGQAIGTGYLTRMDYNSINNAGIATMEWKKQMVEAAIAAGTLTQAGDDLYEAGGKTFTLQQLFIDGLQQQWATTDVMMKVFGDYGDETTEIGKKSYAAAQDIKTFSMMMDSLKATAGTGWKDTWQIIFGDLEEAKELWTGLTNFISKILEKMDNFRNGILQSALGQGLSAFFDGFDSLMENISGIVNKTKDVLKPVQTAMDSVSKITRTLEEHNAVVDEVIRGDWNNYIDRWDALTEAGYDWMYVQNKVNEKLGNSYRRSTDYTGALENQADASEDLTATQTELDKSDAELIASLCRMSDEQLRQQGYTEEQIKSLRELKKIADKLGLSIEELIGNASEIDGRWLLINAFKNLGNMLTGIGSAMKAAWTSIFPEATMESIAEGIFNIIAAFNRFTSGLRLMTTVVDENGNEIQVLNGNGEKLARTFKGIFAALDIILTVVGGPLKIVFKLLTQLIGAFGFNILDVTAFIGDMLVKLRDFIDGALDFTAVFTKMVNPIKNAIASFKEWIASLRESENLPQDIAKGIASGFGKAFEGIKNFFKKIPEFFKNGFDNLGESPIAGIIAGIRNGLSIAGQTLAELGKIIRDKINEFLSAKGFETISSDSIAGLVEGFKGGASKAWNAALAMITNIVEKVKEFLGIHSPSTVFMAIGGFIIAGLVMGLKNGIPDSLGAVKEVLQPILDWLKNVDFGAVLAGVVGVGTVAATNKIGNVLGSFAAPIEGLGDVFEGTGKVLVKSARPIAKVIKSTAKVVKGFGKVLNGVAFSIKADAIKTLGTTLLMLVGAIIVLTFFDPKELLAAVGIVALLALVLVGLAWATNKIGKASATIGKGGLNVQGLSSGLIGIGAAILLLAIAVKMLGSLDSETAKAAFLRLAGLIVAVAAVIAVFGLLVKGKQAQNIDKFGFMMTKMAAALLLMVIVIKLCGWLNGGDLLNALAVFGMFAAMVAVMALITMIPGKGIDKLGAMMLKMSVALLLMVVVIKLAAGLKPDELAKGVNFLIIFAGFVAVMMLISKIGGTAITGLGKMLLSVSVSMLLLVAVMKLAGKLSVGDIIKGTIAIAAFAVLIALMVKSLSKNGAQAPKVALTILAFSVAIGILAAIAIVCGLISLGNLAKGVTAVAVLGLVMRGLIAATRGATNVTGTIVAISVAIAVLVAAVALLTFINPGKLAIATACVSALMGMLTLLIKAAGKATQAWGAILAMSGAILILGGVLYLLATLPVEATIGSAIALGGLLVVMTGVLAAMAIIGKKWKEAMLGVAALGVLVAAMALIVLVLALMNSLGLTDALPQAAALSLLLISLSTVCALMSLIPVAAAISGALGLASFIGIMAGVLLILGGLSKIPGFNDLIADGGTTLSLIGFALGAFVGSIIAGFAGGVLAILPALGLALSGFMLGVTPFIAGVRSVDGTVLAGAGMLLGAILAFAIAGKLATATAILGLGLVALGLEMSAFIIALAPFLEQARKIDPLSMIGISALADAILTLTAAGVIEGLASLFGGGNSISKFAAEFPKLGEGLRGFIDTIGTFSDAEMVTVTCAAQAVKTLASAASEIPNSGGWMGAILGENDLGAFAEDFPKLGTGLRAFVDNIGTFTDAEMATVNCAAEAVKTLAAAAGEIPNSGGWMGAILGENDLGAFAEDFPKLGEGLRGFVDNIGTFSEEQMATVNCASDAVKTLASVASNIPNEGGWISKIVGDNNLGTFSENFPKLGTGLAGFVANIGTFTAAQVATVNAAIRAITALTDLANANLSGASSHLAGFSNKLPAFGEKVASFCSNMPSADTVRSATTSVNRLLSMVDNIANANSGCLATFADNLKKISEDAVKKFVGAFTSESAKKDIKNAATDLADKAVSGAKTQVDDMKSAGKSMVNGFAKGIDDRTWYAEARAKAMANAAEEAAKKALDINSPSKVFRAIGYSVPEGLAMGIDRMSGLVDKSSASMAGTAIDNVKTSISRLSNIVSTDIDSQPTIRPVLDLSDVRAGAGTLANMLNMDSSVGVRANVGAISSMMSLNNQNGATNSDVVSAINKLRGDLANAGGTTYQINGVTYDDGSNISDAVQSIVRAAKIERRV